MISVCIPTYNGSEYLRACLDSVMAQTLADFEVLVVDDTSSDNSVAIAEEYAAADPRVRVVKNERNLGLVGNWNRCIELACGEWIKFVFQDDLIEPDCLEKMLAVARPEIGIVCCKREFIFDGVSEKTRSDYLRYVGMYDIEKLLPGKTLIAPDEFSRVVCDTISHNFVGEPTSMLLHRDLFIRYGAFNPRLIQVCDMEFWARIGVNRGMIYLPERLAWFRVHGSSTSESNMSKRRNQVMMLDQMVMLHDFAFHPVYAPLRAVAAHCGPPVDFGELLAVMVRDTKRLIKKLEGGAKQPESHFERDFSALKACYPILRKMRKIPFTRRIVYLRWKLRTLLQDSGFAK